MTACGLQLTAGMRTRFESVKVRLQFTADGPASRRSLTYLTSRCKFSL
jgi:hypothetical protein